MFAKLKVKACGRVAHAPVVVVAKATHRAGESTCVVAPPNRGAWRPSAHGLAMGG